MPNSLAYPAAVAKLAGQIPAAVVVPADALAYYTASIDEGDARDVGSRLESASILDEILRIGAAAMPAVLGNKAAGYGPVRLRYCFDLAGALAADVAQLDESRVDAAGAGTAKVMTLHETRALRTRAIRVLKNLAGQREEEKSRLAKAAEGAELPDDRARSLEALAKELQDAMTKVPPAVAEDAGATQALVDDLFAAAGSVLGSRGVAQGARASIASLFDKMNTLDGRLLHELRLLIGAMRDARKHDKTVPSVKSPLLKSGHRKKVSPPPAAPPADMGTPPVDPS